MKPQDSYAERDLLQEIMRMIKAGWKEQKTGLREAGRSAIQAFILIGLFQVASMAETSVPKCLTVAAGALAILGCCGPNLVQMLQMTKTALDDLSTFSNALLPVVAATAYTSGNMASAASNYSLTLFFSNLLLNYTNTILFPVLSGYLCFTLTDTALQQTKLKKICSLSNSFLSGSLRILVYGFTGAVSVTTVIAGSRDAAILKALQFSISTSVPVIGGIISDAANSILSGAALIKSTLGIYGMLAILSVVLLPFFRLFFSYLLLKVISAFTAIWDQSFTGLMDGIACIYGYMLAVLGCSAYLSIFACCNLIRMVQGVR